MSDPIQDLEGLAAEAHRIEGAVISHLVVDPVVWAGIQACRPPVPWKRRSIRAARRDRGRMRAAMRAAKSNWVPMRMAEWRLA